MTPGYQDGDLDLAPTQTSLAWHGGSVLLNYVGFGGGQAALVLSHG